MMQPIDETSSGPERDHDDSDSGPPPEPNPATSEAEPSPAPDPAEPRESKKIERYLWMFIAAALALSLVILVLSWRAGTPVDGGAGVGIPGPEYALRVVAAERLSVRSEPRPDASIIAELDMGQLVRVRVDSGDWVPAVLEDGQIIGWLEAAHLGPADGHVLFDEADRAATAGLERLSGDVAGQLPEDLPRVTVRLFEDVEPGEPVGSVVYWYEGGACTYGLELLERADGLMKTAQVSESPSCDPLGEIWFVDGETAMTAIWHRPDGSQWFSSYVTVD